MLLVRFLEVLRVEPDDGDGEDKLQEAEGPEGDFGGEGTGCGAGGGAGEFAAGECHFLCGAVGCGLGRVRVLMGWFVVMDDGEDG